MDQVTVWVSLRNLGCAVTEIQRNRVLGPRQTAPNKLINLHYEVGLRSWLRRQIIDIFCTFLWKYKKVLGHIRQRPSFD